MVAVLDPRLAKAGYRWDVVRALPPMRRTRHRAEAEAFLRSLTAPNQARNPSHRERISCLSRMTRLGQAIWSL